MKNITPQVPSDQHGLAEIGLRYQQRHDEREQQHGEQIARDVGLALMLGKQPGADDDEGRLQELGRLDRSPASDTQRRAPLTSTPT